MKKRTTTSLKTYHKIKGFLSDKSKSYTATEIRDILNVDYESLKVVLKILIEEKSINKEKDKYRGV